VGVGVWGPPGGLGIGVEKKYSAYPSLRKRIFANRSEHGLFARSDHGHDQESDGGERGAEGGTGAAQERRRPGEGAEKARRRLGESNCGGSGASY